MSRRSRLLAPVCVAAAFAVAAPAAHAATITFPAGGPVATTVTITDPGPASDSVHLTVTAADPGKLADTHVFFGASQPWFAIGSRRRPRSPLRRQRRPRADRVLPLRQHGHLRRPGRSQRGQLLRRPAEGRAHLLRRHRRRRGHRGRRHAVQQRRHRRPRHRLPINSTQEIDGFSWDLPAAPALSATGGRRQVALSFDQDRGTQYDIYRVVDGVRTSYESNVRGNGDDVRSSSTRIPTAARSILARPTRSRSRPRACSCLIACRATIWSGPFSALTTVTTAAGPDARLHRRARGEHDGPQRPVQLDDQCQRRRRGALLRARPKPRPPASRSPAP